MDLREQNRVSAIREVSLGDVRASHQDLNLSNSIRQNLVGLLQVFDGLPYHIQKKADQATKASQQLVMC